MPSVRAAYMVRAVHDNATVLGDSVSLTKMRAKDR